MNSQPILDVSALDVEIGNQMVLDKLSLSVAPGEIVSVEGRNGSGKTTLFRTILGLIRPSGGQIWFQGMDIDDMGIADRARIGITLVPQGSPVFDELTVRENLELARLAANTDHGQVTTILESTNASHWLLAARVRTLSGGERQRVAFLMTLIRGGSLILLDELFVNLDTRERVKNVSLLKTMVAEHNAAILFIEHDSDLCSQLANRRLQLVEGRLHQLESPNPVP